MTTSTAKSCTVFTRKNLNDDGTPKRGGKRQKSIDSFFRPQKLSSGRVLFSQSAGTGGAEACQAIGKTQVVENATALTNQLSEGRIDNVRPPLFASLNSSPITPKKPRMLLFPSIRSANSQNNSFTTVESDLDLTLRSSRATSGATSMTNSISAGSQTKDPLSGTLRSRKLARYTPSDPVQGSNFVAGAGVAEDYRAREVPNGGLFGRDFYLYWHGLC